jgi:hypothetical protein
VLEVGFEIGTSQKRARLTSVPATREQTDKRRICISCPNTEHLIWCLNHKCVYLASSITHTNVYYIRFFLWQIVSVRGLSHHQATKKTIKWNVFRYRDVNGHNVPSSFSSFSNDVIKLTFHAADNFQQKLISFTL